MPCGMNVIINVIFICVQLISTIEASIAGMDSSNFRPFEKNLRSEDPCNPLYWYPRHIPEYCNRPLINFNIQPLPVPAPVVNVPIPVQVAVVDPIEAPTGITTCKPTEESPWSQLFSPQPIFILPSPVQPQLYLPPGCGPMMQQGVNILPFSDVYSKRRRRY